jgi:hypothetical protein
VDPWTATLAFAKDVGFPAAVAWLALRMLGDELRNITRRLDDVIGLLGGTPRVPRKTPPDA